MTFKRLLRQKIKPVLYVFEAGIACFFKFLMLVLGFRFASFFGMVIARAVYKVMRVNRLVRQNLRIAFVGRLSKKREDLIIKGMWNNFGRIAGEYFNLWKMSRKNDDWYKDIVDISEESMVNIQNLQNNGRGKIIFSAHFGSWEIGLSVVGKLSHGLLAVYRPFNNKIANNIISKYRNIKLAEKDNVKDIIDEAKKGGCLLMLVDQRSRAGVKLPFFGRESTNYNAVAKLALKYDMDVVPAFCRRIGNRSKFILTVDKPLEITPQMSIEEVLLKVNEIIEKRIKRHPSQWFWVHNRWDLNWK